MDLKAITARLEHVGLSLPAVPSPVASYVPAVRADDTIFVSGQLPTIDGELMVSGKVGLEVDEDSAVLCARRAALNGLAAVLSLVDDSETVRVARVGVFVASAPTFVGQARIANGASELIEIVFRASGTHARSAVGVVALPLDAPVEVELTVVARSA